ncbi:AAA family ATPase [Persicobacter psychrovividus]|uniref:AAA-ATPase-like domain-containing protein n=1 Tax=Persicobacter psychrovividus TaxID=387638 RepID=A0ABM7VDS4_9BACT|nr:hypothetical protein PEPS_13680 [Persicobacter psychrovividus]
MKKHILIGSSDFKEFIEQQACYIDKTAMIEELMTNNHAKVSLFPRPRRFGKTLNMSMLKHFFDVDQAEENRKLFKGLAVEQSKAWGHQGKYPVIFLTLKELTTSSSEVFRQKLISLLSATIRNQFRFLLNSDQLDEFDIDYLKAIVSGTINAGGLENFLREFSNILYRHHGVAPVILIDEYDAPIHSAFTHGYLPEMLEFMRNFLSAGFKDNPNLTKGIITGILRVSKANIFSGLNNIKTYSILNHQFSDCFGLTQAEVDQLLIDANCQEQSEDVAEWYNGYSFGGSSKIYNPWSILNFVGNLRDGLIPYWVNTSSNDLIKEILPKAEKTTQDLLFGLLEGKTFEADVEDSMTFEDLYKGKSATVLGLLLFSGYLTTDGYSPSRRQRLRIPNLEIKQMYERILEQYLEATNIRQGHLIGSFLRQEPATFADLLERFFLNSFSFFDFDHLGESPEKIYHAFMLGLMTHLSGDYHVKSNRESGLGRSDIIIYPKDNSNPKAWVLEFKKKNKDIKESLQELADMALEQIKTKQYYSELKEAGHTEILAMGVAFNGKEVACAW